jgi:hypothetical protein
VSTSTPSVVVKLDQEYRVEFDVDTLLRIEEQVGRPLLDIAAGMVSGTAVVARNVPLATVVGFVAAVTGKHPDQAKLWAGEGKAWPAFVACVPGFMDAVGRMVGPMAGDEAAPAPGPTQPAGSGAQASPPAPSGG